VALIVFIILVLTCVEFYGTLSWFSDVCCGLGFVAFVDGSVGRLLLFPGSVGIHRIYGVHDVMSIVEATSSC
jgi:hypothetical protein